MEKTKILILDGQGGGVGRKIGERILAADWAGVALMAVGSNGAATSNMMKGGVSSGATGENAWLYNCPRADIIVGPVAVMLANAMHGEITPAMAQAVMDSPAEKMLMPLSVQQHGLRLTGLREKTVGGHLDELMQLLEDRIRPTAQI